MHTTVVRSSKEKHILRGRWQLNKSLPQAFRTPHPQLSSKTASLPGVKHCQYKRWNCSQDLLDQWVGATDPKSLAKGIKRLYEWLHSLTQLIWHITRTRFLTPNKVMAMWHTFHCASRLGDSLWVSPSCRVMPVSMWRYWNMFPFNLETLWCFVYVSYA